MISQQLLVAAGQSYLFDPQEICNEIYRSPDCIAIPRVPSLSNIGSSFLTLPVFQPLHEPPTKSTLSVPLSVVPFDFLLPILSFHF